MFRPISSLSAIAVTGILFVLPVGAQAPAVAGPSGTSAPPASVLPNGPTPQGGLAPSTAAQGDGSAGITTIRTYSNLVVIDVVVSDSKGNPVHGLKQSDFTLTEGGKEPSIRSFEEHTALPASETTKITPMGPQHPGIFTNKTAAPANGPVNVLLLDYLNTPLTAQPYARKQLMDFLDKTPAGTRIAIFGLNDKLTMLQGFTSDPATLKAALSSKKGAPQASDILNDPVNGGPQTNTTLSDNFTSNALDADQQLANVLRFQAIQQAFEQDIRTKVTLGAFDQLARYLVGIPGRKNLIWFSGSFPLSIEPDTNLQDPFDSVVRNDDEIRKTDNLLTRAQIAVYPVDARGVFNDPSKSVANGPPSASPIIANGAVTAGDLGAQSANSDLDFMQQTAQEHETMMAMAEDTGGKAFINTNNLTQSVLQAISNGSNYYTLTYSPSNRIWDGRFRAIKVKVEQPGVKLAYRNGYYGDDPNDRNRTVAGSAAVAMSRPTTMNTAMMHGGPDLTEIPVKVRIRPSSLPPSDQPVKGNLTNPDPKAGVTGPYKYYGVDLVPDPKAVSCPPSDDKGDLQCSIEIATYVYNRDGVRLVMTDAKTRSTLSPANYAQMLKTGMAFHQEISVPVKGQYYVRTAIHDVTSDRVGTVEVPVASVSHLPPLDDLPVAAPAPVGPGPGLSLESLMPGLAGADSTPSTATPEFSAPAPAATPVSPAAAPAAPAATPAVPSPR
jgi:VWFA-related protein